jgi:hypothetical protein
MVKVVDGRAQVQPEKGDVSQRQAPVALVYQVRQGLPGESLQDQGRARLLHDLVGARDVRVREAFEQPPLPDEGPARGPVAYRILTQDLGDAAAGPLFAPGFAYVVVVALVEVGDHLVTRNYSLASRRPLHRHARAVRERGEPFPDGSVSSVSVWR